MIRWASIPSPQHRAAALELARAVVARSPGSPALELALARALAEGGSPGQALDRLSRACARFPQDESLAAALAEELGRVGQVEAALHVARRWAESGWAAQLSLKLMARYGRFAEAAEWEAAVAAVDPADRTLLDCRAMRLRHDPAALLQLADDVLRHRAGASHALYLKIVALVQLGRREEAAQLMGLERLVRIAPLAAPSGFASDACFRAELRAEVLANPSLHDDPAGHASSSGRRTRTFPAQGDRAATALVLAIRDAVAAYAAELPRDHPVADALPDRATFTPWALIFAADGHQRLHHHPGSWLTGVYYVSSANDRSGALRIGGLPEWVQAAPPWPIIEVAPSPGTLVLFPSYVPHETVPTGSSGERISVAFDVAAAEDRRPAQASGRKSGTDR